ncbi:hypothetical protein G9A89_000959 [Geosiphon pyriformis]|nr:hypothetical protein G9A89_000959 [Geosiphon pyriformis]
MGTTAHDIWNYIGSVGGKTCAIDHHSVTYAQARCAVVCFDLANFLNAVMGTTLVLRSVNIYWSLLGFSKCAKCGKLGHISLNCAVGENISSEKHSRRLFSDLNKNRLATIYAKRSALITHSVAFGGVSWAKIAGRNVFPSFSVQKVLVNSGSFSEIKPTIYDTSNVKKRFAVLESSLASLAGQIDELAKRLNSFMLAPWMLTAGNLLSQNQVGNVVMGEGLGEANSGETVTTLNFSASTKVKRLESMLKELSASVLSLTIATCNVRGMNNPTKQDVVIRWHKEINNLISVVTETKLRGKICPWIINKFDGVQVFTSGLNSGHLGSGVAIIMDIFLVRHICKVSKILGHLFSLKLLFKNNLSVSILGLYAGVLLVVQFSQAGEINSLIAKAVNKSSFIILGDDFNKDGSQKCASFKKCFDLGLVDSLKGTLNYVLVSLSLVNAVTNSSVVDVEEYFDTDHKTVSASMGLSGLFDGEFKDATAANAAMFLDKFEAVRKFSDLDAMWDTVCKVMVFLANGAFKKKWFKGYDKVFTKESFKLHNLEVLVSKIVKTSREADSSRFESLLKYWVSMNSDKASVVCDLVSSGVSFNHVHSALYGMRRVISEDFVSEGVVSEGVVSEGFDGVLCITDRDSIVSIVDISFQKFSQFLSQRDGQI